jgi:hypothetical protein
MLRLVLRGTGTCPTMTPGHVESENKTNEHAAIFILFTHIIYSYEDYCLDGIRRSKDRVIIMYYDKNKIPQ